MPNYFDESLVFSNLVVKDKQEAIKYMSEKLLSSGRVKETYPDRVMEREKTYPTGLETGEINVAIPHCDYQHVNQKSVCIATLKNPVKFNKMDDPSEEVEVSIIMMLAIDQPDDHIEFLSQVFGLVQNQDLLKKIKDSNNESEIIELVKTNFKGE